ncbi:MAG: hypothetical protein Ct9H300mP28_22260 [Pseudomonadota bacterium]|nr:MAG: hypothetical protein Ct9H300mP28_22260 [Pseudomonadota bacterium]
MFGCLEEFCRFPEQKGVLFRGDQVLFPESPTIVLYSIVAFRTTTGKDNLPGSAPKDLARLSLAFSRISWPHVRPVGLEGSSDFSGASSLLSGLQAAE